MKRRKSKTKNDYMSASEGQEKGEMNQFFRLGRQAAMLDVKQKEIEQNIQLNMAQQLMLQNTAMELRDLMAEQKRQNADLDKKALDAQMGMPMPPGGMPPEMGGMPPVPEGTFGGPEMGGMPPDMGGMPPDMGGGGMPPMM